MAVGELLHLLVFLVVLDTVPDQVAKSTSFE